MAQLVVRHLEDEMKARLRRRAARRGHSMEEEVREILRSALRDEAEPIPRLELPNSPRRFAGRGLTDDLPVLRGQVARPAALK